MESTTFIIKYRKVGFDQEKLGKLKASCWSEAVKKAKNVLSFMGEKLKCQYVFIDAVNIEVIEDWDAE